MNSREVKRYYESKEMDKLYKKFEKSFGIVDDWANKMTDGDLLDENNLHFAMQQLVGVYAKLNSIGGALEALTIEYENDYFLKEEKTFEKIRIQDKDHCKAVGRKESSDLRAYASDFTRYCFSANSMIVTCQSRLKRLSVESSIKGVDFKGDKSNVTTKKWNE